MRILGNVLFLCLTMPAATLAADAVLVVNSNGDAADAMPGNGVCATASGECTLRAAIMEANALAGEDSIQFAIGSGPQSIQVASALPTVTSPVVIDGSTQPGFAGKAIVEINGAAAGNTDGLSVTSGGSTIRRLVINGFRMNGISISNGGGNLIEGNHIGTDITGTAAVPNLSSGMLITGGSSGNRVVRNLLSGNYGSGNTGGLRIDGGSADNVVESNLIGTDVTGLQPLGNHGRGVVISDAPNNVIGPGNVISGNWGSGVRISGGAGTGNLVQGNYIGIDIARAVRGGFGNFAGVQIRSNDNRVVGNVIGGNEDNGVYFIWDGNPTGNVVQGNTIAYNNHNGVGAFYGSNKNSIFGNAIYGNTLLGIELSSGLGDEKDHGIPDGVTPNDPGDLDVGTNDFQNFPTLTSVSFVSGYTVIRGLLNSTPSTTFAVHFFASDSCDASGYGEGQYPLGQMSITTDGAGNAQVAAAFAFSLSGYVVTSTATNPGGSTSEFSKCLVIP